MEDFDREVYGRVPKNVPKVTWEVKLTTDAMVGGIPVIGKQLVGHVDNSSYPDISVDIAMNLRLPKNATKPVPVLMMFGGGLLPVLRRHGRTWWLSGASWFLRPAGLRVVRVGVALRVCRSSGSAFHTAVDCRWLGLCFDQSREHSGG